MIDINELRQSAQAATPGPWYIGSGTYEGRNIYSVEAVTDDEGFTYNPVVATAEDDEVACWDANARLIAAANPAVISELLDRLEAAESDALEQARLNGMGSEREAALMAKLEAAEENRSHFLVKIGKLYAQCDALHAKIEQMEKQVPICRAEDLRHAEILLPSLGLMTEDKLYALPGAQPKDEALWPTIANGMITPDGWKLVPIEPTPTMITAALESSHAINAHRAEYCYRAMLAAAPEAKP